MKKFLIYVLFFMFFSANAVLAVTYSSRPAMPFTEQAVDKLLYAASSTERPFYPQNVTRAQVLEKNIDYFNRMFASINYDFPKTIDKLIHQYNANPEYVSYYDQIAMSLMGLWYVLFDYYTPNEEYVLKKYFSQETVNFFNKNYEKKLKNKQTFVVVQKQTETNPYQSSIEEGIKKTDQLHNQCCIDANKLLEEKDLLSQKASLGIIKNNEELENNIDLLRKKASALNHLLFEIQNIKRHYNNLNELITKNALSETEFRQANYNLQVELNNIQKKRDYIMSVKNAQPLNYGNTNYNYQNTYNPNNTNRNTNNSNNKNYSNVINDAMGIVRDVNSIIRTWK